MGGPGDRLMRPVEDVEGTWLDDPLEAVTLRDGDGGNLKFNSLSPPKTS